MSYVTKVYFLQVEKNFPHRTNVMNVLIINQIYPTSICNVCLFWLFKHILHDLNIIFKLFFLNLYFIYLNHIESKNIVIWKFYKI